MKKYKLLRDCPHGQVGSVWELNKEFPDCICIFEENDNVVYRFPKPMCFDWFEEIKEMPKFTKDQIEAIKNHIELYPSGSPSWWESRNALTAWLDENTEA